MINPDILREYDIRGVYEKSLTLNDVTKIALSVTKILINNKSSNLGNNEIQENKSNNNETSITNQIDKEKDIEESKQTDTEQERDIEQPTNIQKNTDKQSGKQKDIEDDKQNDIEQDKQNDIEDDKQKDIEQDKQKYIEHDKQKDIDESKQKYIDESKQQDIYESKQQDIYESKQQDTLLEETTQPINKLENIIDYNNNEFCEVSSNDLPINDSIKIKDKNEIYLELYRSAKKRAKEIRNNAIEAFLHAKSIKTKYNLESLIDTDSDTDYDSDNNISNI